MKERWLRELYERDSAQTNQMTVACWLEYFCEGRIISYFKSGKIFTMLFLHFPIWFLLKFYFFGKEQAQTTYQKKITHTFAKKKFCFLKLQRIFKINGRKTAEKKNPLLSLFITCFWQHYLCGHCYHFLYRFPSFVLASFTGTEKSTFKERYM